LNKNDNQHGVNSTWKTRVPRGKHHNETATKKTVSLYLTKNVVERAKNHNINLSRVTENALNSILNQLEPQNNSFSLSEGSLFPKRERSMVGRTGFEPATFCTSSRCPNQLDDRPIVFF
jgi:hypothetical protein